MVAFGTTFTDHMVVCTWSADHGWSPVQLCPYGPFRLEPASAVFQYGQEIFEGLKAFRHPDGEIRLFRPEANAARMRRSARRLALPELPEDAFLYAVELLADADRDQVPAGKGQSLYLRPFMFGSEPFLGVRASREATFGVIGSPASAYFDTGDESPGITVWLSETYARAGFGGTGDAKCGGNYAASLVPQAVAQQHGCAQAVFCDQDGWLEETGASALFLVFGDDDGDPTLVTPRLQGTILPSITRDSVLRLARDHGIRVEERAVHIDEWRAGVDTGRLTEAFACGTAAAISPIRGLRAESGEIRWGTGPVTAHLADALSGIQYGQLPDPYGWMRIVPPQRGKDRSPGEPGTPPDGGSVASGLEEIGSVPL